MQRVVRSTLVGLLTIAGLAACGDKITVPGTTTTPPDMTVKGVTVSPTNITVPVGSSLTVGASVDAGNGVTDRTVTWTSADASIATVDGSGKVTGVKAGVTSVTAAAKADPNQKASVAVTVTAQSTAMVSISAINQTVCVIGGACNSVPANVQNFGTGSGGTGQLDVVVNVEPNGAALKTLGGALTCGGKTLNAATQNLSTPPAASDAEANASLITLSFNTVEYDPANGTPRVFNTGPFNVKSPNTVAPCSLQVTLTPVTGSAINAGSRTIELNNADVSILTTVNENGQQAADLNGVPWKSGDVKVSVLPVLYSERGAQSITVTLPGANPATQTITTTTAGTVDFKWLNDGNADFSVAQRTVFGGFNAGVAVPAAPTVSIIDSRGNNVGLVPPVTVPASQFSIALDNQSPQPPLTFQIVQGQGQWVNAFYTFFQVVTGTAPSLANMKYVSCGDFGRDTLPNPLPATPACVAQGGVSAAAPNLFSTANGVNASANGRAGPTGGPALRVFAFDVSGGASIPGTAMGSSGTSTSSNVCGGLTAAGSAWVDVTANPNALVEGPVNTRYAIRALETDRLGNFRCTDLSTLPLAINANPAIFARAFIGVDKTKPTVPNERLQNSNENIAAVDQNGTINAAQAVTNFIFAATDNLSGFGANPVLTRLRRRDAQNTGAGVCVIGSGSSCSMVARAIDPVPVDGTSANPSVSSGIDGIYTYEAIVQDLATNRDTLPSRTAMIDRVAPTMGGVQVPALIQGGTAVSFPTNATDNLDLLKSNFSLRYPAPASLTLRADGPTFGAAFDATFETNRSFSYTVNSFVRSLATTAAGVPQNNAVRPDQITGRALDAVGNVSTASSAAISAANIPIPFPGATNNGATDWLTPIPGNALATFNSFNFSAPAAAVNVSNCSATLGCLPLSTPPVAPANASTVTLTVQAQGSESGVAPAFQFPNPFPAGVSFYYQDAVSTEWVLIATVTGATVSDNPGATIRTFSWSLQWDPAESIVVGNTPVVAVGVNSKGDALASPVNANITITNP